MSVSKTSSSLILVLKLATTLAVSFFLLEFLLLVFNDYVFHSSFVIYDREMGFRVRPHARSSNRFGFNDRDYSQEPAPGSYRIAILGDSFNWAGGQKWNYTKLLEKKLFEYTDAPRIEVLNAGYPATHTAEQLPLLKRFVLPSKPHLILLSFFVGNDFVEADPWRRRIAFGGTTTDLDLREGREWMLWNQPLLFRSRALLLIGTRILEFQNRGKPREGFLRMSRPRYLRLERGRMWFSNLTKIDRFREHEDHIFRSLAAMKAECVNRGVEFIVVALPDEFQVDRSLREAVWHRYEEDPSNYQIDRGQRLLEAFCTRERIEFWDLLPAFEAAQETGQKLYLPNNSHWTEEGNQVAAQELFSRLTSKLSEFTQKR